MNSALQLYAKWVTRRAPAVLLVSLLLAAIVAAGMTRLEVDLNTDQQLPADNPFVAVDRKIRKEFGGKNFIAIALVPESGSVWRRDVLQAVYDLTQDSLRLPEIIGQNLVSLFSPYVRVPVDQGGVLASDYLAREVPADDAGIAGLRQRYRSEPLFRDALVSADERAALVMLDFYDGVESTQLAAAVEQMVAKYRSPDIRIALTGEPIIQRFQATIVREQGLFFAGTVAAIVVVLYLAFGHIQGVILPAATALLSTAMAMGFMGLAGFRVNPWTGAVSLVVMTVAAGHSAQMLKRYYEEFRFLHDRTAAVVASASRIGAVMLAAGGTAACGFAALSLLGIPTLTEFGLGVASGIVAAVLLEMTFMLALRTLWPVGRSRTGEGPLSRGLGVVLAPIEFAVIRHPRAVVATFALVTALAVAVTPRLTTEFDTHAYWSERHQLGRDLRVFERHFPSTTTLTILLEGEPGSMKSPEAIGLMTGLQQAMAAEPGVGRTFSLADMLRRSFEVFVPEEAGSGLPADAALIGQLFFLAQSPAFDGYVDRTHSRAVVRGFLNRDDSGLTRRVLARLELYLRQNPPQRIQVALAGGVGPTVMALNDHTVNGKVLNLAILLAVIFGFSSILLRTALGGAYVVAPLAVALLANLGLFAGLGVAFDLTGASIAAIGVSVGADYAIYFLYRLREEFAAGGDLEAALRRTMHTSGRAILFVAVAISAGFGVYALSDFRPLAMCGYFIPVTMLVSAVAALALLPALVVLLRPRFILASAQISPEDIRIAVSA